MNTHINRCRNNQLSPEIWQKCMWICGGFIAVIWGEVHSCRGRGGNAWLMKNSLSICLAWVESQTRGSDGKNEILCEVWNFPVVKYSAPSVLIIHLSPSVPLRLFCLTFIPFSPLTAALFISLPSQCLFVSLTLSVSFYLSRCCRELLRIKLATVFTAKGERTERVDCKDRVKGHIPFVRGL